MNLIGSLENGWSKAGSKETRETRQLESFHARDDDGSETQLQDLANKNTGEKKNKNTGDPVRFDFQL